MYGLVAVLCMGWLLCCVCVAGVVAVMAGSQRVAGAKVRNKGAWQLK